VIDEIVRLDEAVSALLDGLRVGPVTAFFVVVSAWWVKGVLIGALGGLDELRRRRLPASFVGASVAAALAWPIAASLKDLFDRARPPVADPSIHAAVALPADPSFPSGHATTAFAAATAVALLCPRLRGPVLGIAALVAISRIYLGVHFVLDVVAGAVLGAAIGLVTAALLNRVVAHLAPPEVGQKVTTLSAQTVQSASSSSVERRAPARS
jgi:undecaprenyl-diphosphatase